MYHDDRIESLILIKTRVMSMDHFNFEENPTNESMEIG